MKEKNYALYEYVKKFDELPFLLTTQSYDDDDYQLLMLMAVNRGTPLTEKEIADFFYNQYDIVDKTKEFSKFGKTF